MLEALVVAALMIATAALAWVAQMYGWVAVACTACLAGVLWILAARKVRLDREFIAAGEAPRDAASREASAQAASPPRRHVRLMSASAAFPVGKSDVEIWISHWSGLECYRVNGREVLRVRSFAMNGRRQIPIGDGDHLELTARAFPTVRIAIHHDGKLLHANLFPHLTWFQWGIGVPLGIILSTPIVVLAVWAFS